MSLRRLVLAAVVLAMAAVGAAWAISETSSSFILPVFPYVSRRGASFVFVLAPAAATLAFGLAWRQSVARSVGAGALSAVVVVVLSWVTWIGAIVTYCGLLGHSCFD